MSCLSVSIVIPAKNEPYLETLLQQLRGYEVLVQTEPGLANAVLHGVKRSHGDKVIVMDADGSHPIKYLPKMIALLDSYDVVVGSRYVQGGGTEDSFMREVLSRFFNQLARVILQINVKDNMSGFVAARRWVYDVVSVEPFGYKFGLALLSGGKDILRVAECPIVFEKRKVGVSKTGFGQGIRTFIYILKLRLTKHTSTKMLNTSLDKSVNHTTQEEPIVG